MTRRFVVFLRVAISTLAVILAPDDLIAQSSESSLPPYEPWSVKTLIEYHQQHYGGIRVHDVYKMLFTANFGVRHFLSDTASVRKHLLDELAAVNAASSDEALIERISTNGRIVRVNFRPFKALNLDPDILVKVMHESAIATTSDTLNFLREWNEFTALVRFDVLRFPQEEIREWDARVAGDEFVPVHHSPEYSRSNAPAYRVVRRDVFEAMFGISSRGSE